MDAVILFTKVPIENFCKTRMLPHLKPSECEVLQKILLTDTIKEIQKLKQKLKFDLLVFFTPENKLLKLKEILSGFDVEEYFLQKGEDIFEKMEFSFKCIFKKGYERAILIGSDIFDLNAKDLLGAFEMLDKKDIVIGSTYDKGYYLIGMKGFFDVIFVSGEDVFENTIRNIKREGCSFEKLPMKRDIDTIDDLKMIYKEASSKDGDLKNFLDTLKILKED